MDILQTVLLGAGVIVAIYVVLRMLAVPLKMIFKLVINAVIGYMMLFVANLVGGFFDFSIPIDLLTCLIAGVFGVPGVIFLVVVLIFMR
ncbi:MAG: pro-sigmaK processing inhibitor BofA family protein [Oscillospiraceae bacterium]|jgi:inhibitor of the pro-sigma K processing machinery|nr:pro-sigmaK processing inhibitor BofA family protein [Oscillospiraceae bacterium]